jgi:hypothetical protein
MALLALLAATGIAAGQDAPPAGASSPWNTGTAPPPPPAAREEQSLDLRLYEQGAFDDRLPYRTPRRDPAWAVDVTAVITRCPDGSQLITALVIGGKLTPLDVRCPGGSAPPSPPQCDAGSWNCRTRPSP